MKTDLRSLVRIGLPVSLMSGGFVLMAAVDVAAVAPLGRSSLAALALANVYAATVLQLIGNFLAPVSVLVSRFRAAGDTEGVASVFRSSIVLALMLAVPCVLLLVMPELALHLLAGSKQPPELIAEAAAFSRRLAIGVPAAVLFTAVANFAEGYLHVWAGVFVLILANIVNLLGDIGLIYGHAGLPRLGTLGAAWSTSIVSSVSCVVMLTYVMVRAELRTAAQPRRLLQIDRVRIRQLVKIGLPLGIRTGARQLFYAVLTAIVARFGAAALAANQIALSLFVVANVLHGGFNAGISVLIAAHVGRNDGHAARATLRLASTLTGTVAVMTAVGLIVFAPRIAEAYSADPDVIEACTGILRVCALAHVSTAIGLSFIGAMMATLETKHIARASIPLQFGIGIPLAWILSTALGLGPATVWFGACVSELVLALLLRRRFLERTQERLEPAHGRQAQL